MKEQFVTYEIALKLKELGFDEECLGIFDNQTEELLLNDTKELNIKDIPTIFTLAPLWQQAIDWLETKGFYINITRVFQWSPLPIKFSGWCIYIGTENPEEELECNSYYVDHYCPTKQEAREQAILKAIELCQKR